MRLQNENEIHLTCGSILALVSRATANIHAGYDIIPWTRTLTFTVWADLEMKTVLYIIIIIH